MYFCKSCGEAYATDEAVLCVRCGVAKGEGTGFCHYCGKPLAPGANVCMNCGVSIKSAGLRTAKSKNIAGLLGIFFGGFGAHNFYLGYMGKAVAQLVITIIGLMFCFVLLGSHPLFSIAIMACTNWVWIWAFVEAILIFTGKINRDADGIPLSD